jgi:hypothetical protein
MSKRKDEINEVLGSLFEGIVKNQEDEARENFGKVIEALKASPYGLKNAEHFNTMIMYQVKKVLGYAGLELAGQPVDPKNKSAIKFLYTNYDFLEHQVRELFTKLEGSSCCADKSRYILSIYKKYLLTGEIPEDDFTERKYSVPRHGNHQDWLDLVKGAVELYYGEPKDYVETCNKIIKSEKRMYKAIYHSWFCTIDGTEYMIYETYQDKGSPFDEDGICIDEDYPGKYLIHTRGHGLDKYESHPEHRSFHIVPIEDVTNIRHEEEEVDV